MIDVVEINPFGRLDLPDNPLAKHLQEFADRIAEPMTVTELVRTHDKAYRAVPPVASTMPHASPAVGVVDVYVRIAQRWLDEALLAALPHVIPEDEGEEEGDDSGS